jgi:hypothetical protein
MTARAHRSGPRVTSFRAKQQGLESPREALLLPPGRGGGVGGCAQKILVIPEMAMGTTPLMGSGITVISEHIRMYVIRRLGQGGKALFTVSSRVVGSKICQP